MVNQVELIGRLVNDPVLKHYESCDVATTTLAITRPFRSANGEFDTDFIRVAFFEFNAKHLAQYCSKGDLIAVRGRLQVNTYDVPVETEDDVIKKRLSFIEVIGERIVFLSVSGKKKPVKDEDVDFPNMEDLVK